LLAAPSGVDALGEHDPEASLNPNRVASRIVHRRVCSKPTKLVAEQRQSTSMDDGRPGDPIACELPASVGRQQTRDVSSTFLRSVRVL
jgi:hypothetical protein